MFKKTHLYCGLAALTPLSSLFAGTETPAKPAPAPAAPAAPYAPIKFGKLTIDLQEKMRFESRENNWDFNSNVNDNTIGEDGSWLLQRFRLGLGYEVTPWLKFYVQGQDIREIGSERPNEVGTQGAEGDDTFDILKAYVDIGNAKKGLSARIGRQFLSFGDQRLVGPLEWLNSARAFDAIKLHYAAKTWQLNLFTSSVVNFKDHMFNQSDFLDNDEERNSIFSGAYFNTTALGFQSTDFYVFHQMNDKRVAAQPPVGSVGDTNFYTIGTLWKGDPKKLGGFDYEMELAYQWGKVANLDLSAFAGHWAVGYNIKHSWKPRIGVQFNYGSGDQDPNDNSIETFQNLYPTNHLFYGFMDTTGWINMLNPQLNLAISPTAKLKITLDYHMYWSATNDDTWYRVNGVATVRPLNATSRNASNYRGSEIDLVATYKVNPHFTLQAGYSYFMAGDYLTDTKAGVRGDDNAHFGYLQAQIDF
jgi:hypothetical protein